MWMYGTCSSKYSSMRQIKRKFRVTEICMNANAILWPNISQWTSVCRTKNSKEMNCQKAFIYTSSLFHLLKLICRIPNIFPPKCAPPRLMKTQRAFIKTPPLLLSLFPRHIYHCGLPLSCPQQRSASLCLSEKTHKSHSQHPIQMSSTSIHKVICLFFPTTTFCGYRIPPNWYKVTTVRKTLSHPKNNPCDPYIIASKSPPWQVPSPTLTSPPKPPLQKRPIHHFACNRPGLCLSVT